jgi:integrase
MKILRDLANRFAPKKVNPEQPRDQTPAPAAQSNGTGWEWVEPWICGRHELGYTRTRYLRAWRTLVQFFQEAGVQSIKDITREHCFAFIEWRKRTSGVCLDTCRHNLLVLGLILREAVLRGLINANPAAQLGIKRPPPKKTKPEYSTEVLDEIAAYADTEPGKYREFYRISFAIARYHGVRLAETRFPLDRVNLAAGTVTFIMKGSRTHTVPLHPKLRPMLEALIAEGRKWTFTEPSNPNFMSTYWQKFLKRHGFKDRIPNACFHALRVTCISRLARANVSQAKAMRYVNHASETVHKIYQRVSIEDMNDCADAL